MTIDPVGATEIAARCGVDLGTVKKWQHRYRSFPRPRRPVGGRPAWDWALDIVPWLTATRRPVPDLTIPPWTEETTMATTTIPLGAEYSTIGQMDDIYAYLGDTFSAEDAEVVARALFDRMRDEVDDRLPDGWSWQPGASELIVPVGYSRITDEEFDEILREAWDATKMCLENIVNQVMGGDVISQ